jgi:hypothetical protein
MRVAKNTVRAGLERLEIAGLVEREGRSWRKRDDKLAALVRETPAARALTGGRLSGNAFRESLTAMLDPLSDAVVAVLRTNETAALAATLIVAGAFREVLAFAARVVGNGGDRETMMPTRRASSDRRDPAVDNLRQRPPTPRRRARARLTRQAPKGGRADIASAIISSQRPDFPDICSEENPISRKISRVSAEGGHVCDHNHALPAVR